MSHHEPGLKVHQQSKSDDDHSERKIKELHVPSDVYQFFLSSGHCRISQAIGSGLSRAIYQCQIRESMRALATNKKSPEASIALATVAQKNVFKCMIVPPILIWVKP
jgi:hypothetical protein